MYYLTNAEDWPWSPYLVRTINAPNSRATDPYSDLPLGYHNFSFRYRYGSTSSQSGTIRAQRKMDNYHLGRNHLLPNADDVDAHNNLANVQPMHCESDLVPDAL